MKVLRKFLIDTIDKATRDYDEQFAVWNEALEAWHQEQYDKWVADYNERWRGVRDYLTKRTRDGRPIVYEEIGQLLGPSASRYSQPFHDACWHKPSNPPKIVVNGKTIAPPSIIPGYSHALRLTLDAIVDDVVSDHQLRQIGFNNLEKLFQVVVQNGGTVGVQQ